jgi:hypothetical protein
MVKKAAGDLYGSYDKLPESSRTFIEAVYDQICTPSIAGAGHRSRRARVSCWSIRTAIRVS